MVSKGKEKYPNKALHILKGESTLLCVLFGEVYTLVKGS